MKLKDKIDILRMRAISRRLKSPVPITIVRYEVFKSTGKIRRKWWVFPSRKIMLARSYKRNYYNALISIIGMCSPSGSTFEDGVVTQKRYTDGSIWTYRVPSYDNSNVLSSSASIGGYRADLANGVNGILVGTSSVAESFDDYNLGAVVVHGNGEGQLLYQEMPVYTINWTAGTLTFDVSYARDFTNNSGGDITVEESCIVAKRISDLGGPQPILLTRDLTSGVVVPNDDTLRVTYNTFLTFPE